MLKPAVNEAVRIASKEIDLVIDDRGKYVIIHGKKHHLSPKEYTLLKLLAAHAGQAVSTEEIAHHLWPANSNIDKTDVTQCIRRLRKKIENTSEKIRWIHNVKGYGYQLSLMHTD